MGRTCGVLRQPSERESSEAKEHTAQLALGQTTIVDSEYGGEDRPSNLELGPKIQQHLALRSIDYGYA